MKRTALLATLGCLFLLAVLGLVLRQAPLSGWLPAPHDHLRHAHSHLAFLGWAWGALTLGLVEVLTGGRWTRLLAGVFGASLAVALVTTVVFGITGYSPLAIRLLGVHTVLAWLMLALLGIRVRQHPGISGVPERRAWRWASAFFVASSLGPLAIPLLGLLPVPVPQAYPMAIHFYLHFHYDAWFVLAWLSLWFGLRAQYGLAIPKRRVGWMAALLGIGAVLTYGLPFLDTFPTWRVGAQVGGGARLAAAILLALDWRRSGARQMRELLPLGVGWALAIGFLLFLVKEGVQWLAAWSYFGQWLNPASPSLRVAYLHLLFLGVITPFLLVFFYAQSWLRATACTRWGWRVYWTGFAITEWYLLADGLGLGPAWRPAMPLLLLVGAILLLLGILSQLVGVKLPKRHPAGPMPDDDFPDV